MSGLVRAVQRFLGNHAFKVEFSSVQHSCKPAKSQVQVSLFCTVQYICKLSHDLLFCGLMCFCLWNKETGCLETIHVFCLSKTGIHHLSKHGGPCSSCSSLLMHNPPPIHLPTTCSHSATWQR